MEHRTFFNTDPLFNGHIDSFDIYALESRIRREYLGQAMKFHDKYFYVQLSSFSDEIRYIRDDFEERVMKQVVKSFIPGRSPNGNIITMQKLIMKSHTVQPYCSVLYINWVQSDLDIVNNFQLG